MPSFITRWQARKMRWAATQVRRARAEGYHLTVERIGPRRFLSYSFKYESEPAFSREALILWDSSDDATHQIKSPEAVAYVASLPSSEEHSHASG